MSPGLKICGSVGVESVHLVSRLKNIFRFRSPSFSLFIYAAPEKPDFVVFRVYQASLNACHRENALGVDSLLECCFFLGLRPSAFQIAIAYVDSYVVVCIVWCPFLKYTLWELPLENQLRFEDGVCGVFECLAAQSHQSNILLEEAVVVSSVLTGEFPK